MLPLIKVEVLPKIKYIEKHSLLRHSVPNTNSLGNLIPTKEHNKRSPLDFPSEELFENDLQTDAETGIGIEDVKRLSSWIYTKGLYKKTDNDFRRTLRTTTIKKVAAIRLYTYMDDHDSYIIKIASQQLKGQQVIDSEGLSDKTSLFSARIPGKTNDGYSNTHFKGLKAPQGQSSGNSLDAEIRTELQALTYKKYLQEKKDYLRKLIAENDELVQEIKAMRIVTAW
jgi:hypothetical protein